VETLRSFLQERWRGLRPALWGTQLKEAEFGRAVYAATLNIDGVEPSPGGGGGGA
jgi:glycerol-3-phosphate dehydrogenase